MKFWMICFCLLRSLITCVLPPKIGVWWARGMGQALPRRLTDARALPLWVFKS